LTFGRGRRNPGGGPLGNNSPAGTCPVARPATARARPAQVPAVPLSAQHQPTGHAIPKEEPHGNYQTATV